MPGKRSPNKPARGWLPTTICLTPELLREIEQKRLERRLRGVPNSSRSAFIREAVSAYLEREAA